MVDILFRDLLIVQIYQIVYTGALVIRENELRRGLLLCRVLLKIATNKAPFYDLTRSKISCESFCHL